ncbi:MAG: hypothetical protein K2L51_04460, partial [Clostridiales bacterium]|nr:hypothetical protein [Clostridiales bacterium]
YYSYKMKQVICPRVFNEGGLYMQVIGQPQFVSASDESMNEFKDGNGQPIVGDQRSQLMLVVNEPSKAESDAMQDALLDRTDLTQADIKASSTYQIDLQMCGLVQKVPTGSYMRVGFGFPAGYGPNDAGVTFTVYHYTRKADGTIDEVQEIPCVVTEYGIIATVKSFSPFMICAVDASKASAGKRMYACTSGVGGEVSTGEIVTVASGKSHTYTFTADKGYKLESVTLNGTDISEKLQGNTLTLGYDDLQTNNEVEATFVSERVATARAASGLTVIRPRYVVTEADMIKAVPHETGAKKNHTALIVTLVIVCVVVAAGVAVLAVFFLRKKKDGGKGGDKKNAKSSESVKTKKEGATLQSAAKPHAETSATRTAQPAARPASTTRPAQPAARPASATRPAQPAARPSTARTAQSAARPSTARPAQPAARPSATRPAQPAARPASATRPASGTKPSAPKK